VSKQDTHFFNTFSLVIGILVAVAIALFALARSVASETQEKQMLVEKEYLKGVDERLQPFAKVAVSGQDNSALKIEATSPAGSAAAAPPKNGDELFEQACKACHGPGIAGAPKAGDKAAWAPRIAKGKDVLYDHALHGFTGTAGMMPAKGGRADVSDDLVKQAVDHMLDISK
jgi:cytochrome c5